MTWRPRGDFRHISEIRDFGGVVTTISCDIRLESWLGFVAEGGHHTFLIKLCHDGTYSTQVAPDSTTVEPAPDDPDHAIIIHYLWNTSIAGLSLQTIKWRLEGTTDNVLTTFHVAERIDVGSS